MKHFGKVLSAQPKLLDAHLITVEADYSHGLHAFSIVGLPDKAVEEARDRVGSALKNSGFSSPKHSNKKVVISLAPAHIKKEGALFDTPIALAYLLASEEISFETSDKLFVGELGLDGAVRPVHGVLPIVKTALQAGIKEVYVPMENAEEGALIEGIAVYGYSNLSELVAHINLLPNDTPIHKEKGSLIQAKKVQQKKDITKTDANLDDIRGQEHAKRGLMIAAAGGHNIAFYGPPGTGKTMLASALASIIPELTFEEMLRVHSIHSVAGVERACTDVLPPIRSPHHTSSYVALVGGGTIPKPGEITLAHHGVLFLDEFPEFDKRVINSLRQPLEDGVISIARAKGSVTFPSRFILVAAMNPCPCGYGEGPHCTCSPLATQKYKQKISGPILDRIDMWIEVTATPHDALFENRKVSTAETNSARKIIHGARQSQQKRFSKESFKTNSALGAKRLLSYISVTDAQKGILKQAATTLNLSPRGTHRVLRLARTIADLDGSKSIEDAHILEALQYRAKF